jgi:ubiquinone biosynthesis protein Coq4
VTKFERMNLRKLLHMIRAYRAGAPLGDVVVLKLDALSAPAPSVAERLRGLGDAVAPDLPVLRRSPEGTFGRAYVRFLDENGIVPLVVSAGVRERFRDDPYALRYTTTHDLHHVLTGFDTGLAGEIGVLAFNVAQGSAPVSRAMLRVVSLLWAALAPTQARRIWHNVRVGFQMGERAALVIAAPLASSFDAPLARVRQQLGIPEPGVAGVLASGDCVLGRLLYPGGMARA